MHHLRDLYPNLCVFILKRYKNKAKIEQYREYYKSYEDDPYNYCMYVHGYFIPWIEDLRAAGKLKQGKLAEASHDLCVGKAKVFDGEQQYEGEVDEDNLPCGVGRTVSRSGTEFIGTWL